MKSVKRHNHDTPSRLTHCFFFDHDDRSKPDKKCIEILRASFLKSDEIRQVLAFFDHDETSLIRPLKAG